MSDLKQRLRARKIVSDYYGNAGTALVNPDGERAAARIEELEAALDAGEKDAGLSENGGMWRFWSRKAMEATMKACQLSNAAEAKLANRATIEIRPASDIPAFGAYIAPVGDFTSPAKIAINFAACIGAVAAGDLKPADVPAVVLQTIWHEIGHAIEHWAGVEFSEDRVEALAMQLAPTDDALR